jgi:hypothetical protein
VEIELLDFMLVELLRREKNVGIKSDEDLDVKALAFDGSTIMSLLQPSTHHVFNEMLESWVVARLQQ